VPVTNLNGNPTGVLHDLFMENDFLNPQKVVAWRDMIEALGRHLVQRYGNVTHQWAFEHWNEPMVIDKFCADGKNTTAFGSFQSMFNYYDACENGLARADPGLRIGGPSTHSFDTPAAGSDGDDAAAAVHGDDNGHGRDPFVPFLEHCDTGTNYFSNNTGTRLDFISIHRKGSYKGAPGGGNATNILAVERTFFRVIREKHPKFLELPFWNDEADPISGWAKFLSWRPGPIYAAFMVSAISQHIAAMEESASDGRARINGVPYALISNDNSFTGCMQLDGDSFTCDPAAQPRPTWLQRTLLTTFTRSLPSGENQTQVIKKPDLTVMALLNRLGSRRARIEIASAGAAAAKLGGVATVGAACTAVLLYRSDNTAMTDDPSVDISLHISGMAEATAAANATVVVHWGLSDVHGNPFKTWTDLGSPAWPTDAQMTTMEAKQEPVLIERRAAVVAQGTARLAIALPLPAVSLVQVCAQPAAQAPAALPKPTLMSVHGGPTATVVVSWAASRSSETLRTYEVEASVGEGGAFTRVNAVDVIATAWIHRRPASDRGAVHRCYRVRAVDYWARGGPPSEPACV
jgi:L-iduronidase